MLIIGGVGDAGHETIAGMHFRYIAEHGGFKSPLQRALECCRNGNCEVFGCHGGNGYKKVLPGDQGNKYITLMITIATIVTIQTALTAL